MSGKPLRFLIVALAGWTGMRTVMLWPASDATASPPRDAVAIADTSAGGPWPSSPSPTAATTSAAARLVADAVAKPPRSTFGTIRPVTMPTRATVPIPMAALPATSDLSLPALAPSPAPGAMTPVSAIVTPAPSAAPLPGRLPPPARWSGSAWLLLRRGDDVAPGLDGGQLGGTQAGVRLAYAIDPARRLAVFGRLAGPIRGIGREAAVGIEWRPTRLPVRLVVEHRFALDGGKGGPAAGVVAGTGPAPLGLGFDLESYAQAGVVRRIRTEPFVDGAVRVTRPLVRIGPARIDLGAGGWGGAQRDAQRLDVGPTIGVRLPIAGRSLRLLGDWRQRVAGRARPDSGPALTVGLDF